jgi:hypothetical protein
MWKKAAVAKLEVLPGNLPGETEETTTILRITGPWLKI